MDPGERRPDGAGQEPAIVICPVCGSRTDVAPVAAVHAAAAAPSGSDASDPGSLAAHLAPPIYPRTRRGTWVPALFLAWFAGLMGLMFLQFVPQSFDIRLSFTLITWLTWGFGLVGLLLAVLFIQTPRTRRESLAIWEAAYYCRPDDLVFIPGYPYSASPPIFHRLIREQPQRWLLRAE